MKTLFVSLALCAALTHPAVSHGSDLIISNARIYTVNEAQPEAQAVVVTNGEIVYVGGSETALTMAQSATRIIDAKGMMLLPGFIDTHNHVFEGASDAGGDCMLSPVKTLDQQDPELQACKDGIEKPGDWLIGYGHQLDELWGTGADPNPRNHLDEWFPDNPVIIMEESSHSILANSLALDKAGINQNSDHPQGGRIMFAADGEPNGVLFDNAGDIVMELAWNSLSNNFQVSYDGLLAGMDESVRYGITTIGDGRLYWRRGWYEVWQAAQKNDALIVRTSLRPWIYPGVPLDQQIDYLSGIGSADKSKLLIVDQVKMYIDGVVHFGTAKVQEPYQWSWQEDLPLGLNYISPNALPGLLQSLDKIGYGAHVHAIGDGGIRETLDAIQTARTHQSKQIYSMTHLEMVDPNDIGRFQKLDVHADFQAGADFFANTRWARFYVGRDRADRMMPMREIFDTGANVSFSSDWTVNSINPLVAIANSVSLSRSRGLPDVHAAIRAATINGARALGLDTVTGSIEVGKSADFVLLDQNIIEGDADQIRSANVMMTILQGEVTFGDASLAGHAGAWFNPETSGQGLFIDVEPDSQFLFMSWFTYTDAASDHPFEQRWLTAQGNYIGNTAELGLYETLGGRFDDPQQVTNTLIGEVTLRFNDCNQGLMTYRLTKENLQGEIPLSRLIGGSGSTCEAINGNTPQALTINHGVKGAWFDPQSSGQGFFVDAHSDPEVGNVIFSSWFTYGEETASGLRWLTAQGSFDGTIADIEVFETTGGSFNDSRSANTSSIGTMQLDFADCSNAKLSYSLPADSAEGTIAITRVIPGGQAVCEGLASLE